MGTIPKSNGGTLHKHLRHQKKPYRKRYGSANLNHKGTETKSSLLVIKLSMSQFNFFFVVLCLCGPSLKVLLSIQSARHFPYQMVRLFLGVEILGVKLLVNTTLFYLSQRCVQLLNQRVSLMGRDAHTNTT